MEPRLLVNNYNENIIKLIQSSEGSERFERKLPLKKGQSIYLRNKLINKGFSNLHETRIITSIYFDTEDYSVKICAAVKNFDISNFICSFHSNSLDI